MGSHVVKAIVIQRGSISTNPDDKSPNPSVPIQQVVGLETDEVDGESTSRPVEQQGEFRTAESSPDVSISAPVEQRVGGSFSDVSEEPPNDSIIEQKFAATVGAAGSEEEYDGHIQQLEFSSESLSQVDENQSTKPIEQKSLERLTPSEPLEQVAPKTAEEEVTQFTFIQNIFPPCGSLKNPVNTNILWRIQHFGDPYDVDALIFRVNGVNVQDNPEFLAQDIPQGLRLFYNPPSDFDYESEVDVYVQVTDTAEPPNTFFASCIFSTVHDTRPPIVENVVPTCWSTGVGVTENVEFDVRDTGLGVDLDSIVLNIEGLPVCSGLSFDSLITTSGNGYHVTWEHVDDPFLFDSNVTVAVKATDLSPLQNSVLFLCSFDTEESEVPVFKNFDPQPCDSFIDNTTGLYFEVYGVEYGIDISTLEVRVDNARRRVYVSPRILRSE